MSLEEVIQQALSETTLQKALTWVCVWESERAIQQAIKFSSGSIPPQPDGSGWHTCFGYLIGEVLKRYPKQISVYPML